MPIGCSNFPISSSMRYQQLELLKWQKILKPEVFQLVHNEAIRQNSSLPPDATGYDVWRGEDICNFIRSIEL